jgi:chorismate dehydratase
MRTLLAEMHGLFPVVTEIEPQAGILPAPNEGILIIGDRCFEYDRFLREEGHAGIRSWDLGELWWNLTGLPFVFAVWAVAKGFPAQAGGAAVATLKELLAESLRHGLDNLPAIAAREAAAGRLGYEGHATAAAIEYYFQQSLHFAIGAEELAGIRYFHQLAVKHDVIPAGPMPPIL